ncbi:uncharacterized protein V1516DRAFT_130385 [Lipomyces oligophaga]|uniref:uncharacterized protein n=1 Tax=Lipomyces oligophaga TaxID=45792 RepID=UPI0034CFD019
MVSKSKDQFVHLTSPGTWQNSFGRDSINASNITRIARALKPQDENGISQITYYQNGIGTGSRHPINSIFDGIAGQGLKEQMQDAYGFLSLNYDMKDEIFFFGFSRGAFMVRAICSMILEFGILKRPGMTRFGDLFNIYMTESEDRLVRLKVLQKELIENNLLVSGSEIVVQVVGCFDTVGTFGLPQLISPAPSAYWFLDLTLNKNVKNAFHALALDETRLPFSPLLWFFDESYPYLDKYKQVWFVGAHINVGGGNMTYTQKGTDMLTDSGTTLGRNTLADGTLIWMIGQTAHLLGYDVPYLHGNIRAARSAPSETSTDGYYKLDDTTREPCNVSPWYRGPIADNYAGVGLIYILLGTQIRQVLGYDPPVIFRKLRTNLQKLKELIKYVAKLLFSYLLTPHKLSRFVTKERIHKSVMDRGSYHESLRHLYWGLDGNIGSGKLKVDIEEYSDFEKDFWAEECSVDYTGKKCV